MDTIKIKQVGSASPTAEITSLALAMATRNARGGVTNTRRLKRLLLESKHRVVEEDYKAFWRGLEQAGVGSVLKGSRFRWHCALREVAKVAIEGKAPDVRVSPDTEAPVTRSIILRIGLKVGDVVCSLPSGLSKEELKIVSEALLKTNAAG